MKDSRMYGHHLSCKKNWNRNLGGQNLGKREENRSFVDGKKRNLVLGKEYRLQINVIDSGRDRIWGKGPEMVKNEVCPYGESECPEIDINKRSLSLIVVKIECGEKGSVIGSAQFPIPH